MHDEAYSRAHPGTLLTSLSIALKARWWIALVTSVAILFGTILYLRSVDYLYTAELHVAAAPGTASRGPGLGGLSGLAAIAGVGIDVEATPFRLYLDDLASFDAAEALAGDAELMRQIFKEEWQEGGWQANPSVLDSLTATLLSRKSASIPAWEAPDARRLQAWLQANVGVEQGVRSPVVVLRVSHPDPAFAKTLLARLHDGADSRARSRALARARANIAHLDARMSRGSELDHRQAMVATRAAEAQRLMLARNPAAFAANPLSPAAASPGPTSPRAGLILAIALVLGAGLGVALALILGPPAIKDR